MDMCLLAGTWVSMNGIMNIFCDLKLSTYTTSKRRISVYFKDKCHVRRASNALEKGVMPAYHNRCLP